MYSNLGQVIEMLQIFKTKNFSKWAKKERIVDRHLKKVASELIQGLSYNELGSGLFKKRIACPGQGKRGSYRTLLAFKKNDRLIFMFGFSKSDRENIDLKKSIFSKN